MKINEIINEATGDAKFDSVMSRMIKEPRIPDAQQQGISQEMMSRFKEELDKFNAAYHKDRKYAQQMWPNLQRQFLDYGYELSMGDFDPNMPNEVWLTLDPVDAGLPTLDYVSRDPSWSRLQIAK
jgi:hypothetical protein